MSETATKESGIEMQRLILDLTRIRADVIDAIERGEQEGKSRFYERGVVYGLNLALTRLELIDAS